MNKQRGFTLIEVLIVVSIIGLLTSATLIGLGSFRGAGRDARRLSDLRQIQNGLELYYAKYGNYPASAGWEGELTTGGIGIPSIPKDPSTNASYTYSSENCTIGSYILAATLEEKDRNSKIYNDSAASDCGVECVGQLYCISF